MLRQYVAISIWAIHQGIVADRTEGTGKHFEGGEAFQNWLETPGSILWITGDPGAGKTYLACGLYEHAAAIARTSQRRLMVIIYLRYTETLTIWDIILSTILHIVESKPLPKVIDAVNKAFEEPKRMDRPPSLRELTSLLDTILQYYERTDILFDGLDEMKQEIQAQLVNIICKLQANVIITSRVFNIVQDKLNALAPSRPVFVTVSAHPDDLELFINQTIDQNPIFVGFSQTCCC